MGLRASTISQRRIIKLCGIAFGGIPRLRRRDRRPESDDDDSPLASSRRPASLIVHSVRRTPPLRRRIPHEQPPPQLGPREGHAVILLRPPFHHPRLHPVGAVGVDDQLGQPSAASPTSATAPRRRSSTDRSAGADAAPRRRPPAPGCTPTQIHVSSLSTPSTVMQATCPYTMLFSDPAECSACHRRGTAPPAPAADTAPRPAASSPASPPWVRNPGRPTGYRNSRTTSRLRQRRRIPAAVIHSGAFPGLIHSTTWSVAPSRRSQRGSRLWAAARFAGGRARGVELDLLPLMDAEDAEDTPWAQQGPGGRTSRSRGPPGRCRRPAAPGGACTACDMSWVRNGAGQDLAEQPRAGVEQDHQVGHREAAAGPWLPGWPKCSLQLGGVGHGEARAVHDEDPMAVPAALSSSPRRCPRGRGGATASRRGGVPAARRPPGAGSPRLAEGRAGERLAARRGTSFRASSR